MVDEAGHVGDSLRFIVGRFVQLFAVGLIRRHQKVRRIGFSTETIYKRLLH